MKTKTATAVSMKAAETKRKAALDARSIQEAQIASERIRKGFEDERQALARRYGGSTTFSGHNDKN